MIFFFTWTMGGMFNVAYAAYNEIQKPASNKKQEQKPEEKFQKAMDDIRTIMSDKSSLETRKGKLKEKRDAIESLDKEIQSQFTDTENKLKNAGLPQEILQRHYNFVKNYENNLQELRNNLDAADNAKTDRAFQSNAEKIRQHLGKASFKRSHKPLDPNKLPHRLSDIKRKEPRTKPEEFQKDLKQTAKLPRPLWEGIEGRGTSSTTVIPAQTGIQETKNNNKPLILASNGPLTGLVESLPKFQNNSTTGIPPFLKGDTGGFSNNINAPIVLALAHDVPTAADLAQTIDVQITPAIKAKAAELNYSPVKIYNWVRNNVEYVPTYGSIQGADMCLQTKQGNDFDMASLLIALLRASGIHARYVYGTIELPIDKVMNWVGGFTNANAAVNFIASGGTPVASIISGGKISSVRMEHVWVEGYIKYYPLRGASHETGKGDTWIPLDASYKQYNYTQGVDIKTAVPFDAQGFIDQIQSTAIIDQANSSVTGVNCQPLGQRMDTYKQQFNNYLDQQYPNAAIGSILGKKEIIKQEFTYLLGTMPYRDYINGVKYAELPDSFRHKIEIKLLTGQTADITIQKSLPEIAGHKITLGYIPSTQSDADVINSYLPAAHGDGSPINYNELPSSLPAYLINLKPELRIDNNVIAAGSEIGMGWEQSIAITISGSNRNNDLVNETINAGEYSAITTDTGRIAASEIITIKDRLNTTAAKLAANAADLTREGVLGDILYGVGLSYFAELDKLTAVKAKSMGAVNSRLPSLAVVTSGLNIAYVYGVPQIATSGGMTIDILSKMYMAAAVDGDKDKKLKHSFISGLDASALSDIVMDKVLAPTSNPQSVSAIKILSAAQQQNIPVYTIDQSNINAILPLLQTGAGIKTDIQNAVNAGLAVVTSRADVTLNGWNGASYVIIDKDTGDGAYNLTGGINGGTLKNLPWISYNVITAALPEIDASLINLSRLLVNDDSVKSLQTVEQGIADFNQSMASSFDDTLVANIVYDGLAANLGCYINTVNAGSNICPAIYMGAVCAAQQTEAVVSANARPVASAVAGATVPVNTNVIVDGSASSDADDDPLSYAWTMLSRPQGSSAALSSYTGIMPVFTTDQPGLYRIQLIVSDGKSYSDPVTVSIMAAEKIIAVPDLTGMEQTEAEAKIAQIGLSIGSSTQAVSDTITAGKVISQSPVAGTMVFQMSAVNLVISSGSVVNTDKPSLDFSFDRTPPVYNAGEQVKVTITATDKSGSPTLTMTLDGNDVPVIQPTTIIETTGFAAGSSHRVAVKATNAAGNATTVSKPFSINDPNNTNLPEVAIIAPANNAEITKPVDITGNVTTVNLLEYTLAYSPVGKNQFAVFARNTNNVNNGVLGKLDPTMMKNGIYDILLKATSTSGKVTTAAVQYRVSGEMKVGNFTVAFTDVNVPVAGIPVTVTRMYDSREKSIRDFGYGWTMDIKNINVQENIVPGISWAQDPQGSPYLPTYCIEGDNAEHYVTINLPDGSTNEFDLTFNPQCQQGQPIDLTQAVYNARPGTTSTLQAKDASDLYYNAGRVLDMNTGDYYKPEGYILTTAEGMVYDLDKSFGIKTITDPNGNKITYSNSGILHNSGKSVQITRDAQNRITQITEPSGATIKYEYDASGDLVAVTDQNGNKTTYTYNSVHGLIDIKDPRGINAVKNIYDDSGRLTAHIDAYGNRIEYTHNVDGKQEIVKDRNGNITVFIYDEKGRVLQKTDALGNATTYTYDAVGNKLTETDPLGNVTTNTYDSKKNKLTETRTINGQAVITSYTYNAQGKVLTTTDPRGFVTTNTYDTAGNLLTTRDALGNTTTNTYNGRGDVLTTTDPLGNIIRYEYDSSANRTKQTDARGNITTYTYNANGNKLTETDARGNTTGYAYDAKGNVIAVTNPQGGVTRTEYDKSGNKVADIDASGVRTTYVYNAANKLIQTNYPDGTTVKVAYDNEGNRTSATDALNRNTTYQYDVYKNLTKVTYADNTTITYGYNAAGRHTTVTDPSGKVTTKQYDSLGRVTRTIDPEGNVTSFAYDLNGNQTAVTDANNHTTTYAYDAKGQQISTTLPGGQISATAYDQSGRKTSVTDAAGNVTQYAYDQNSNLIKVTDAENNITQFEYDANNNKTAIIDANGHTTTFAYDSLNRLTTKTMPNGGVETYTYDATGKQAAKTDALNQTIQYTHDARGRLLSRSYPDGSIAKFNYDATGNRITATDKRGNTNYTYDTRNKLTKAVNPDGKAIDYTYDLNGRIKTIATETGTITYNYSSCCGRLQSVTDENNKTTTYAYDPAGNRTGLNYPNGTSVNYTYDTNNRLTNLTHTNAGQTIASYTYTLGATGNRTQIQEANGIRRAYTYDKLFRLTKEQVTDTSNIQTYTNDYVYDAVGNRQAKTGAPYRQSTTTNNYTYNNADQLVSENGVTYTYDLNGNLKTKMDASGTTTYSNNYDQKLTKVEASTQTTTYKYDVDGNRVETSTSTVTSKYLIDANRALAQVAAEYNTAGTITASYTYADDLISMIRGSQTYYYHFDGLGSTRLLTNSTGTATDKYDYDAFGNIIAKTGTTNNQFLFTGQQYDANIGFYYQRARYYQPTTGRFTAYDPIEGDPYMPISLHKYLYTANDPVNKIDPSGEMSLAEVSTVTTIINILSAIAPLVTSRFLKSEVRLCKRSLEPLGGFGLFARFFGSEKLHHEFIAVQYPRGLWHTYGFETQEPEYSLKCGIEGPGSIAYNNNIDQQVVRGTDRYLGSCSTIDCTDVKRFRDGLDSEMARANNNNGKNYYRYCLIPSVNNFNGMNCQRWAGEMLRRYCK